jgi:hypothetical protein
MVFSSSDQPSRKKSFLTAIQVSMCGEESLRRLPGKTFEEAIIEQFLGLSVW